ncbi:retrotransposon protein, putative, ty1-copia subclass [Tanacetum coccineum]
MSLDDELWELEGLDYGKANGKGKDKQVYIPKPKNPKPSAKEHPAKDDTCHHCKEVGHCKRNCPAYLAELIKKKKQVGISSSSDNLVYLRKMTPKKPFPHVTKGNKDLLGINTILIYKSMMDIMGCSLIDLPLGCKGYISNYGLNYEETFSPVADIRANCNSSFFSGIL